MDKVTVSARVGRYLAGLAFRLRDDQGFMAHVLSAYQAQERLDDVALAERLGTVVDMLSRLALCRRPSVESEDFADQVRQIAAYVSADPAVIANIIHQVDSLETWAARSAISDSGELAAHPSLTNAGLLAAARDRDEIEADQTPSPEQGVSEETE